MKKRSKLNIKRFVAILLIACAVVSCIPATESYEAAVDYNNAKEFFEAVRNKRGYAVNANNGIIYFATQAKLAASSSNLRYYTLGFDVRLEGNGKNIVFSVKRGGSLKEITSARRTDGTYEYLLYQIPTSDIIRLAQTTGDINVSRVLSAGTIDVQMDAIMTTLQNGKVNGGISENGKGGITVTSNPVYHMKNSADLREMKSIFSGHTFDSYTNINMKMRNPTLTVLYDVRQGVSVGSGYSVGSYTLNGIAHPYMLYKSGSIVSDSAHLFESLTLENTGTAGSNLTKTGYYLPAGNEWTRTIGIDATTAANGTSSISGINFASSKTATPKDIVPEMGNSSGTLVLYANWKPNPYTIYYDANGGEGAVTPSSMAYDTKAQLRANAFTRTGYRLKEGAEWNTMPDGTGTSYKAGDDVLNLTFEYNGKITLYANWEPCVYQITTDKQDGTGGTDMFYEKFDTGFYSTNTCTSAISGINLPSRTGYTFMGYFSSMNGKGNLIVTRMGVINVLNNFYSRDALIHADWKANKYAVTFDKQGGEYGSDAAIATYDQRFPVADAPKRDGYTFKGYYTEKNGAGTQIYNENMASDIIYKYTNNVTLYAHWVDDILPQVELTVNISDWTNQKVILTAEASDYGVGLKSLYIYKIREDGSLVTVASAPTLNGAKTKTLSFTNLEQGIIRYKAVVTDVNGCTAESYNVAYYDVTAPSGSDVEVEISDNVFDIELDITDINTGN